jgi:hypothetical protein
MRTTTFQVEALTRLFEQRKVATMGEMKEALGTAVDMTVFRKLRSLSYLTSYSHRGAFYTLRTVAQFDARGLWSHAGAWFSESGSLVDTVERFVDRSSTGYFASELAAELHVEVKQPLLTLLGDRRVARAEYDGVYLYTSPDAKRRRQQRLGREAAYVEEPFGPITATETSTPDEVKAAIVLFLSVLDEKQRRLFAGLESLRLGRGGDRRIAAWTGLDPHTVGKGRAELQEHDVQLGRVRRPGGGRPSAEKKRHS